MHGTRGRVQQLHGGKGRRRVRSTGGEGSMGHAMVTLNKLIIETEGSTAPQEIDVQRKKSSLPGNCW